METKVWGMAEKIGSEFSDECFERSIIGLGWSDIGDLRNQRKYSKSRDKLRTEIFKELKKEYGYKRPHTASDELIQFKTEMKKGHWVVLTIGSSVSAYGQIAGDYCYDASGKGNITHAAHRRKVVWKEKFFEPIKAEELTKGFADKLTKQRTVKELTINDLNELRKIRSNRVLPEITSAPTNEFGVICLFSIYLERLGFKKIIRIQNRFPDCIALQQNNRVRYIEFEHFCSSAKEHRENEDNKKFREKCDLVVCWENDWKNCPVEVIELKRKLKIKNRR